MCVSYDVEVGPKARHEMPPSVAFKQYAPREADSVAPLSERGAVGVVEGPDEEAADEDGKAYADGLPHQANDLLVSRIDPRFFQSRALAYRDLAALIYRFAIVVTIPFLVPEIRPQLQLHHPHAPSQDSRRQQGIARLMERRIATPMIPPGNAHRQRRRRHAEQSGDRPRRTVLEGGPEHDEGGVDHAQLVDKLHRVFEGGVEGEAADADEEVAEEGEGEDARVGVVVAVAEAAEAEVEEGEVGQGVDDFG